MADAEFAAWTARQRAGDVGPSIEERAVWREALARIRGVPPEAQARWIRNFDDEGFLMMMHYAFLAWKVQKQDASC